MTISSVNSEEACQISVSQAMKHLKPDNESEMLSAEDTFPSEATTAEGPHPTSVSLVSARLDADIDILSPRNKETKPTLGGLKTTINCPNAIERDKMNYLYSYDLPADSHIPGVCKCAECIQRQEALMAWAMTSAQQQHAQSMAQAVAAAEEAQKSGQGPKPMMVTPYKHNWVISGTHPEKEVEGSERWFDVDGILNDLDALWKGRQFSGQTCCSMTPASESCRMM